LAARAAPAAGAGDPHPSRALSPGGGARRDRAGDPRGRSRRRAMTPPELEAKIDALAAAHAEHLGYSGFDEVVGRVGPFRRATLAGGGRVVDICLFPDGGAGLHLDWRWIAYERVDYSSPDILLEDLYDRLMVAVEAMLERAKRT